jgi:hypothetical protein
MLEGWGILSKSFELPSPPQRHVDRQCRIDDGEIIHGATTDIHSIRHLLKARPRSGEILRA